MRLIIIAPESFPVPSAKGTSVETCIYNIATELAKRHSVTVLSRSAKPLPRVTTRGNLRIIRVPSGSRRQYISRVLRLLASQSFDHIQVDNRPSFLGPVRKHFPQVPLSLFLHSLTFITPPKTSVSRVNPQLAHADMIVTNSHSLQSHVSGLYPSQRHKIRVAHLGVTAAQFRPPTAKERARARAAYGVGNAFVITYAGRFIPLKGIPTLIKAAELVRREIPTAKLLLAGNGKKAYVSYLKTLARRAAVPVRFVGHVPWQKMQRVYWGADCFVCPSQGHEAFGLVVLEALASGLPTVASLNGGIQEIIAHNVNGLLVEDFSKPEEFAKAIIAFVKDQVLARRLGSRGRQTCLERFSWRATSESVHGLYFGGENRRGGE